MTHNPHALHGAVLLHEALDLHGRERPEHVAIDEGARTLTYGLLVRQSVQLCNLLREAGAGRNQRVGLLIENSCEVYIAIFGALRADCCYVPLDPKSPPSRLAGMIEDADLVALVTVQRHLGKLAQALALLESPSPTLLVVLDADLGDMPDDVRGQLQAAFALIRTVGDMETAPETAPASRNIGEDLAYIIYTSGTTGKPKGVMVSHNNVKAFTAWCIDRFHLGPDDRMSGHPSVSFDLSVFDVFGALLSGATLCPVMNPGDKTFPGRFIREQRITVWCSVPSTVGTMIKARQIRPNAFAPHLRMVFFCGDTLQPEYAQALLDTHPDLAVYNLYGPTEATCACTCHHVGVDSPLDPNTPVPVGKPFENMELIVLNENADALAAPGELGRLMICGSQLAAGYWRRPQLTAAAFRPNPLKADLGVPMYDTGDLALCDEQGIYHFRGRRDSMVKYMGYRIELGEIEGAIRRQPAVLECAVCFQEKIKEGLVAAVALRPEAASEEKAVDLQELCKTLLPRYMVPDKFLFLDELPKSPNGKIDRKKILAIILDA